MVRVLLKYLLLKSKPISGYISCKTYEIKGLIIKCTFFHLRSKASCKLSAQIMKKGEMFTEIASF